ncbi:MAG TPA: trigger factor [Nitrospinota bacterium]|nr:trigger factor [Nitrospinota bacterium]
MKVEISDVKPSVKKLKIEVPTEIVNREIDEAYKNLSKSANIQGFRKGKAPRKILEQHYKDRVESDVLQRIIPKSFAEAIKEHNIRPVTQPNVEDIKMEHGAPLSFSVTVETLPDVSVKDFNHLEFTRTIVRVTNDDVEKGLKGIQEMQAEFESSDDHHLESHDYVIIDYEGFSDNHIIRKGVNHPIFVGSKSFIPEFEEGLIGLKKGESKDIKITFPANHHDKELAGKEVNFKTTVREVKKRRLKPIDDNFAKELGEFENLEALKSRVRGDLEDKERKTADSKVKNELVNKLIEMNPVELPPQLIEEEIDSMVHNTRHQFASQGIDLDKSGIDMNKLRDGFRDSAIRNLKSDIILEKIAEKESIAVSDTELDEEIKKYALSMRENFQVLKRKMQNNGSIDRLRKRLLIDKTFDAIINLLKVSDIHTDRESEVGK